MRELLKVNLRLFDDVTNATTSTGSGNNLSAEMKTYYSKYLIKTARPNLVHDQFGQKHPIPKNGGKSIEFRKYTPLNKATTPLTEGVTPDGSPLDVSTVTSTVKQYGNWIPLTDMLLLTAIDNNMIQALDLLGTNAGVTLDTGAAAGTEPSRPEQARGKKMASRMTSSVQAAMTMSGSGEFLRLRAPGRAMRATGFFPLFLASIAVFSSPVPHHPEHAVNIGRASYPRGCRPVSRTALNPRSAPDRCCAARWCAPAWARRRRFRPKRPAWAKRFRRR